MTNRRKKANPVHGWVLLDKPAGLTSTRAVAIIKRLFNAQKAGHAGTLDPLATGLLPIALGEATKTVSFMMGADKTYQFTVHWGCETNTNDAEGEITARAENRPSKQEIETVLAKFTGVIMQTPPSFSAIRIKGVRAYAIARAGAEPDLVPRPVDVKALALVDQPTPATALFVADCSKGTYIRALARDMGRELGCFGHIHCLRRTRIGSFAEPDMIPLDKLEEISHSGAAQAEQSLGQYLLPIATALDDIPALAVTRAEAGRLRQGQPILMRGRNAPVLSGPVYAVLKGTPVALAQAGQGEIKPTRVFNLGPIAPV